MAAKGGEKGNNGGGNSGGSSGGSSGGGNSGGNSGGGSSGSGNGGGSSGSGGGNGNEKSNNGNGGGNGNSGNNANGKSADKGNNPKGLGKDKEKEKRGKGWGKGGKWRNLEEMLQQGLPILAFAGKYPAYLMEPSGEVSYTYDEVGNRLSMTTDQGETKYSYDEANRLLEAGDTYYEYDANGNLVFKAEKEGARTEYQYDAANRLSAVYFEDGTDLKYVYDGYGRKILREETYWQENGNESAKVNGNGNDNGNNGKGKGKSKEEEIGSEEVSAAAKLRSESTAYLYDGRSLLKEYTGEGSPLAEYYLGQDGVIARNMSGYHGRKDQGRPELQTRGGLMYYSFDALGNVTDLTDRTGEVITQFRFDAFGGMYAGTLAPYNYMGLTGKDYDPKSGLIDFSARWYDPEAGRFTQPDTFKGYMGDPISQHPYAYVGNNPINYVDPTGHESDMPEWMDWDDDGVADWDQDDSDTFDQDDDGVADWLEDDTRDEWDYNDGTGWDWTGGGGSGGGSSGGDDDDDDDDWSPPPPPTPEQRQASFNQRATAKPVVVAKVSPVAQTQNKAAAAKYQKPAAKLVPQASYYESRNKEAQKIAGSSAATRTPSVARLATSFVVSAIPIVGTAYGIASAVAGKDLITGEKLSAAERVVMGVGSIAGGAVAKYGGKLAVKAATAISKSPLGVKVGGIIKAIAGVFKKETGNLSGTYGELKSLGVQDAHHIIQNAAVKDLPGYSKAKAPAVQLQGPSTRIGSPHYKATQVQRQAGGGNYAAERRIAYKALRRADIPEKEARRLISETDNYFIGKLGITPSTPTRIPANR